MFPSVPWQRRLFRLQQNAAAHNTFNMPRNSAEKLIEKHGKTAPELSKRLEEGVPARILAGNSGHKYGGISK